MYKNMAKSPIQWPGVLGDALRMNRGVHELDLEYFYAFSSHLGMVALFSGLWENKSLQRLTLNWNKVGDDGAKLLAKALLQKKNALEELDLSNCDIGDAGTQAIMAALRTNRRLVRLDLANNRITNASSAAVVQMLKENAVVKLLLINNCRLRKDGRTAIVYAGMPRQGFKLLI